MLKFKSHDIKSYLVLLIVIFIFASVFTNIYVLKAFGDISIESELYNSIKDSNDLIADMLPPKLYIVESYLLVQQIATERDGEKTAELLEKLAESRADYFAYYKRWQNNTHDETISALLLSSHNYVSEFYRIYDDEFLLALAAQDYPTMQEIANLEMRPLFEKHREIIVNASDYLETSNTNVESNAQAFAHRLQIILFSVYLFSLFIIIIISLIIFKKVSDTEKHIVDSRHETELANERLETMVEGLKKFKHSHDNILASINGYVLRDDTDGLKTYLDEIIAEKSKKETVNYFKLNFIKNPAVTGLIIAKMIYAEKFGIEFTLKVRSDVTDIKIKSSHLSEILGILLDNAIEAAADSEEKHVSFKIEETEEAFIFDIKNTLNSPPDQTKMFEEGWTTKGENRGFGLWMAKDIIARYDNVLLTSTVDTHFVEQELLVFKNFSLADNTVFTDIL